MLEKTICFIDCETTGLDPERHVPWEIAIVIGERSWTWTLELTVKEGGRADPNALRLTDYYERVEGSSQGRGASYVPVGKRREFAANLARRIGTRHLAGNVVSFDARMVGDFLRRNGSTPAWHYHLVDVEAVAAGRLGLLPPWDSEELSRTLKINPDAYERHTALGDALWAQAVYDAAMETNRG